MFDVPSIYVFMALPLNLTYTKETVDNAELGDWEPLRGIVLSQTYCVSKTFPNYIIPNQYPKNDIRGGVISPMFLR